jgi:hypothetical protein
MVLVSLTAWTATTYGTEPATAVRAPMVCSRGPDVQFFEVRLTLPATAPAGSTYTVRIDSVPAAKVSGTGLNYLHDMLTDYYLPQGATYVTGSAHVVSDTGTENVRNGARVWHDNGFVRLHLPGHVDNGSTFTPPSLEFQVKVSAPAGTSLPIQFVRHRLSANVFLLGNLDVVCSPRSGALTIGTTLVTPPPP